MISGVVLCVKPPAIYSSRMIQTILRKPVKVATDSILKLPPKPGQSCHFGGA